MGDYLIIEIHVTLNGNNISNFGSGHAKGSAVKAEVQLQTKYIVARVPAPTVVLLL